MSTPPSDQESLTRLGSLDDPTRRRLYEFVAGEADPVSRDQAAGNLDLDRSTVAYHLDKLVEQGLLAASFARPEGRTGPGAGRPAKHYERVGEEITVSLPPRDYRLAAEILVRAAEADETGTIRQTLAATATEMGEELGAAADQHDRDLVRFLAAQGFEPYRDGAVVRLRNCPFHALAQRHTELICGINVAMLDAAARQVASGAVARLDPAPDRCCVAFAAS
jgi:predicted ArsR family transcriptional regulator